MLVVSSASAALSCPSSSGLGDLGPFGVSDAPKRVAVPEKDPKASFDLGTDPLGAGEDPNTEGPGDPKAEGVGPGELLDAAARNGEGFAAKAENPLAAKVGLGAGDVVREGDLGVVSFENTEDAPKEAKAGFQGKS